MERDLRPALDRVIPVVFQSKLGGVPQEWSFSFRPLYQMKEDEKAKIVQDSVAPVVLLRESNLINEEVAVREIQAIGKKYERFTYLVLQSRIELLYIFMYHGFYPMEV